MQTEHKPESHDLAAALSNGEVSVHHQPKVDLRTGAVVGAEALARWMHPQYGFIPPSFFIPLAEASGLIDQLTQCVIGTVAYQGPLLQSGEKAINIAVNVSAQNLANLDFPDQFEATCKRHGYSCRNTTIELTESATQTVEHLLDTLTRLRLRGTRLSLDDFGTGYSSLVQLHQLPFSEMKIDRSFVIGMETSKDCRTIVRSIIDLAHNLGLEVIAEGVETAAALDQLREFGCDLAQGYHIGRPMPPDAFRAWLTDYPRDAGDKARRLGAQAERPLAM